MHVRVKKHILQFIKPARTSRGELITKTVYYIIVSDDHQQMLPGVGECSVIPGLSIDDVPGFEQKLSECCKRLVDNDLKYHQRLFDYPSIRFGIETALRDFDQGGKRILYPGNFTDGNLGIDINGLIWMDTPEKMYQQVREKIENGFTCLKFKIGALDFNEELNLLWKVRREFQSENIEIRLDANGGFDTQTCLDKLSLLSELGIHSIEQPIMPGQLDEMSALCEVTPIPIALDEELIPIQGVENKQKLLEIIRPQYIILKPGLLGGFQATQEYKTIADKMEIKYWVTSALESNLGLSAIAQWTSSMQFCGVQGLGTGLLFENNVVSPLTIRKGKLYYSQLRKWDEKLLRKN